MNIKLDSSQVKVDTVSVNHRTTPQFFCVVKKHCPFVWCLGHRVTIDLLNHDGPISSIVSTEMALQLQDAMTTEEAVQFFLNCLRTEDGNCV